MERCAAMYETAKIIGATMIGGGGGVTDKLKKKIKADYFPASIADVLTYANSTLAKKQTIGWVVNPSYKKNTLQR